jgi:hypothetical protein
MHFAILFTFRAATPGTYLPPSLACFISSPILRLRDFEGFSVQILRKFGPHLLTNEYCRLSGVAAGNHYSRAEVQEVLATCKDLGLEVSMLKSFYILQDIGLNKCHAWYLIFLDISPNLQSH